jgi:hypothetical protein
LTSKPAKDTSAGDHGEDKGYETSTSPKPEEAADPAADVAKKYAAKQR